MIYITGDTHGMIDWEKLNTTEFPEQKDLTRDDYVIIVGDFGGVWDGAEQDRHILMTYSQRNFTTLFIDGNHENHDLLDKYPVEEWNGGKVHRISDNVIHLMRGQVFTVDGTKIFAMGGAESTDREWRREGESWWAREMPSQEEYEEALSNLSKVNFKVDIVLTHCAPEGYIGKNKRPVIGSDIKRSSAEHMAEVVDRSGNELTDFLDGLITERGLKFGHWFFGHYHNNLDWGRFSLVFGRVIEIKKE
ncbi:MAG: metallophosphoesterase [Clostridiales bacterium]|nr:metallophosphoesterase [Clostridiales bacterium]